MQREGEERNALGEPTEDRCAGQGRQGVRLACQDSLARSLLKRVCVPGLVGVLVQVCRRCSRRAGVRLRRREGLCARRRRAQPVAARFRVGAGGVSFDCRAEVVRATQGRSPPSVDALGGTRRDPSHEEASSTRQSRCPPPPDLAALIEVAEPVQRGQGAAPVVGQVEALELLEGGQPAPTPGWRSNSSSRRPGSASPRCCSGAGRSGPGTGRVRRPGEPDPGARSRCSEWHTKVSPGREPPKHVEAIQHMAWARGWQMAAR